MQSNKIGIVGSGVIGSSWAMIFASGGYRVSIFDSDPDLVHKSIENIKSKLEELERIHALRSSTRFSASQQLSNIRPAASLAECVSNAFHIQECIYENLEAKESLLMKIDDLVDPGSSAVIASSTSTILPSLLSSKLKNKANFLVAHPINPPYVCKLVEVIPAPWTREEVKESTLNLLTAVGQSPILLRKEVAGFAVNRLQYAVLNQGYELVKEGILSASEVDKCFTEGLGMRWAFHGPFNTARLNAPKGFSDYCQRYSTAIHEVSKTFAAPELYKKDVVGEIHTDLESSRAPIASELIEREELLCKFGMEMKVEHTENDNISNGT